MSLINLSINHLLALVCFIQIVATAKTKMHEIQDVVSIAANGTVDCVAWLMDMMQQGGDRADQPLVDRAISVACMGLDSALITSEALMDRVLPPTEEDKGAQLNEELPDEKHVTFRT